MSIHQHGIPGIPGGPVVLPGGIPPAGTPTAGGAVGMPPTPTLADYAPMPLPGVAQPRDPHPVSAISSSIGELLHGVLGQRQQQALAARQQQLFEQCGGDWTCVHKAALRAGDFELAESVGRMRGLDLSERQLSWRMGEADRKAAADVAEAEAARFEPVKEIADDPVAADAWANCMEPATGGPPGGRSHCTDVALRRAATVKRVLESANPDPGAEREAIVLADCMQRAIAAAGGAIGVTPEQANECYEIDEGARSVAHQRLYDIFGHNPSEDDVATFTIINQGDPTALWGLSEDNHVAVVNLMDRMNAAGYTELEEYRPPSRDTQKRINDLRDQYEGKVPGFDIKDEDAMAGIQRDYQRVRVKLTPFWRGERDPDFDLVDGEPVPPPAPQPMQRSAPQGGILSSLAGIGRALGIGGQPQAAAPAVAPAGLPDPNATGTPTVPDIASARARLAGGGAAARTAASAAAGAAAAGPVPLPARHSLSPAGTPMTPTIAAYAGQGRGPVNTSPLAQLIKVHEAPGGRPVLEAYKDGNRHSIGYGTIATAGQTITAEEAEEAFNAYMQTAVADADRFLRGIDLDPVRYAAIVDMAWNKGGPDLMKLTELRALLAGGKWERAAQFIEDEWSGRVKGRARDAANMIRTGEWPDWITTGAAGTTVTALAPRT